MLDSSVSPTDRRLPSSTAQRGLPGFTILEALVVTAIFFLVLLGVYQVYDSSLSTFWRTEAEANIQQSARSALERIRQELRNAGFDPSGTGQLAVQNPTANSVEFVTDIGDNNISDLVKYDRDATTNTLRRTVKSWTGAAWGSATVQTLATNANSLTFQYFPSAAVPGLTRIRVVIVVSEVVPTQPTRVFQVSTDVFLRNL